MEFIKNIFKKEIAIVKNDVGEEVGRKTLLRRARIFNLFNRAYNIQRSDAFRHIQKGLIQKKVFYFYNLNCSTPLSFSIDSKSLENNINPEIYSILLENDVIKKLNKPQGNSIFSNMKPEQIIIGIGIIGSIIYFLTK